MVRGRARGGKGSLCPPPPPPPQHPKSPTWTPPPNRPSRSPLPSNPPPQGASGQQLVGGVVGVQNRGVAPPGDCVCFDQYVHLHLLCALVLCCSGAAGWGAGGCEKLLCFLRGNCVFSESKFHALGAGELSGGGVCHPGGGALLSKAATRPRGGGGNLNLPTLWSEGCTASAQMQVVHTRAVVRLEF